MVNGTTCPAYYSVMALMVVTSSLTRTVRAVALPTSCSARSSPVAQASLSDTTTKEEASRGWGQGVELHCAGEEVCCAM